MINLVGQPHFCFIIANVGLKISKDVRQVINKDKLIEKEVIIGISELSL